MPVPADPGYGGGNMAAMRPHMLRHIVVIALTSCLLTACDEAAPTSSTVMITNVAPLSGSVITPSRGTPPGVFLDRGSGKLAVTIAVQSIRESSFAQLYVFLLTADGNYCGQNLPDMPTWQPLRPAPPEQVTITGFQIFRVPCDVVGIRAMLHTRIGGQLFPPSADQTIAETTMPIALRILPTP